MSDLSQTFFPGENAVGVIDFNGVFEAASTITVGGTVYTEADTADAPNGVFTNGASAANSATSFAAAVNDDTRAASVGITAVVSDAGDSVVLFADQPGTAGNYAVTTTSAANATVEDMKSGRDPARKRIMGGNYTVTDQDVLADEINIGLPFAPSGFVVNLRTSTGLADASTFLATLETTPNRLLLNFAGATDPVAGDIVHYVVFE